MGNLGFQRRHDDFRVYEAYDVGRIQELIEAFWLTQTKGHGWDIDFDSYMNMFTRRDATGRLLKPNPSIVSQWQTFWEEAEECSGLEIISVIILLGKDKFGKKLKLWFELFDSDDDGVLTENDFEALITNCIVGILKCCAAPLPPDEWVKNYATFVYHEVTNQAMSQGARGITQRVVGRWATSSREVVSALNTVNTYLKLKLRSKPKAIRTRDLRASRGCFNPWAKSKSWVSPHAPAPSKGGGHKLRPSTSFKQLRARASGMNRSPSQTQFTFIPRNASPTDVTGMSDFKFPHSGQAAENMLQSPTFERKLDWLSNTKGAPLGPAEVDKARYMHLVTRKSTNIDSLLSFMDKMDHEDSKYPERNPAAARRQSLSTSIYGPDYGGFHYQHAISSPSSRSPSQNASSRPSSPLTPLETTRTDVSAGTPMLNVVINSGGHTGSDVSPRNRPITGRSSSLDNSMPNYNNTDDNDDDNNYDNNYDNGDGDPHGDLQGLNRRNLALVDSQGQQLTLYMKDENGLSIDIDQVDAVMLSNQQGSRHGISTSVRTVPMNNSRPSTFRSTRSQSNHQTLHPLYNSNTNRPSTSAIAGKPKRRKSRLVRPSTGDAEHGHRLGRRGSILNAVDRGRVGELDDFRNDQGLFPSSNLSLPSSVHIPSHASSRGKRKSIFSSAPDKLQNNNEHKHAKGHKRSSKQKDHKDQKEGPKMLVRKRGAIWMANEENSQKLLPDKSELQQAAANLAHKQAELLGLEENDEEDSDDEPLSDSEAEEERQRKREEIRREKRRQKRRKEREEEERKRKEEEDRKFAEAKARGEILDPPELKRRMAAKEGRSKWRPSGLARRKLYYQFSFNLKEIKFLKNIFDSLKPDKEGLIRSDDLCKHMKLKKGSLNYLDGHTGFMSFRTLVEFLYPLVAPEEITMLIDQMSAPIPTRKTVRDLKQLFQLWDNYTGRAPYNTLLTACFQDERFYPYVKFIKVYNSNREIQFNEFAFEVLARSQKSEIQGKVKRWIGESPVFAMTKAQREQVKNMFDLYDEDGSGEISIDEHKEKFQEMMDGNDVSDEEWEDYFKAIDADGDGLITLDELMVFFRATWDTSLHSTHHRH